MIIIHSNNHHHVIIPWIRTAQNDLIFLKGLKTFVINQDMGEWVPTQKSRHGSLIWKICCRQTARIQYGLSQMSSAGAPSTGDGTSAALTKDGPYNWELSSQSGRENKR